MGGVDTLTLWKRLWGWGEQFGRNALQRLRAAVMLVMVTERIGAGWEAWETLREESCLILSGSVPGDGESRGIVGAVAAAAQQPAIQRTNSHRRRHGGVVPKSSTDDARIRVLGGAMTWDWIFAVAVPAMHGLLLSLPPSRGPRPELESWVESVVGL